MSMRKALQMEFWKCRRRMVGLVCLAFVAVQLLWVGRTLFDMTPERLSQGWMLIIYDPHPYRRHHDAHHRRRAGQPQL